MRQVIIELSREALHNVLGLPYGVTITDVMLTGGVIGIKLEGDKFPLVPDEEPIPKARIEFRTEIRFTTEERIK